MLEQFHFIEPLWLLALLPPAILLWLLGRYSDSGNPWRRIVDARLLPLLMGEQKVIGSRAHLWLLSIGWLLAVLALANPTWEQQPQAVLQTGTSRVIVFDLSRSMLAADLKPSRLVRARFKVEDMLAYDDEGQTGLVVFAGDAFSVTPLTRDVDTIRAQLKALSPGIMPIQGSRADLGLLKAQALLQQAGVQSGQVILIADGVEGDKARKAAAQLRRTGYRVSVLGVGTIAGAPLPDGQGSVIKDAYGKPRLVKLERDALQSVAQAGGGRYTNLSGNDADIRYLLHTSAGVAQGQKSDDLQMQKWKEQGPLLAVLLLPFAALAFRRGWLLGVVFCIGILTQPRQAMAFSWNDMWLRNDQQAALALENGHYGQAAKLAEDPLRRGSAEYKKGDYQQALDAFNGVPGVDAAYNRGNALARLGNYQAAIAAYDEVLTIQPGMEDAAANKAAVEELLKKQQQQQQKKQGQSGQSEKQDQQSGNGNKASGQGESSQQNQGTENTPDEASRDGKKAQSGDVSPSSSKREAGTDKKQPGSQEKRFSDAAQEPDEGKPGTQEENSPGSTEPPVPDNAIAQKHQAKDDKQAMHSGQVPSEAEELSSEEQLAAQQWLRRIPDDPGGLLRRKFLYQYRQRAQSSGNQATQNW